jgi:AcrR family transcriptional regulator
MGTTPESRELVYLPVRIESPMTTVPAPSPERILRSALSLFSEKGYDATSVREICEASGITKPTLYHFYGSKEGVYRALVDGALERFRTDLEAAIEGDGTLAVRLRRLTVTYFEAARGHPDLARFILALTHNPPSSAPRTDFLRFYGDVLMLVARAIETGEARGEIAPGPVEVRLLVLMGALGEAMHGYLLAGRPELTPTLAGTLVDVVLGGWVDARSSS